MTDIEITVIPNTEDPEVGGFFAEFTDGWGRGFGSTELSALFSLVLLYAENEGVDLSEQAGDIVVSLAIKNERLEKALEHHYGAIQDVGLGYDPSA